MAPLRVTARLAREIANPARPPALDGLLAYAQAVYVEGREPPDPAREMPPVDITRAVAPSPCRRYHLASFAVAEVERMERGRFVNRRFPVGEAQYLCPRIGSINLSGGPTKSFRIPLETGWLRRDRIDWFVVGDRDEILRLLSWISHLGKRRGVGLGALAKGPDMRPLWEVEAVEPWGDGFPVIQDGRPLRNLPFDAMHPEAAELHLGFGNVSYPYFQKHREEHCIVAASLPTAGEADVAAGLPDGLDAFLPFVPTTTHDTGAGSPVPAPKPL